MICGAPISRASSSSAMAATVTPLTVTDQATRYVLACEALESTKETPVIEAFLRLFKEYGLPNAIRSDNGLPFASPNGLYNLSKLSGLLAQARHRDRAHQARQSAAKWSSRAHAPHAEAGKRRDRRV